MPAPTWTFTLSNGSVFGRDMVWRRLLEAQPSEWRAILADPGFRAEHAKKQATALRARPAS